MDALLNPRQTAEMLNLAAVTVRKLVRSGKLPAVKIGRHLLFEPDKLVEFVAQHRTAA